MTGKILKATLTLMMVLISIIGFTGCGDKKNKSTESKAFLKTLEVSVSKNADGTSMAAVSLDSAFDKENQTYTITVDSGVMVANVAATAENDKTIVSGAETEGIWSGIELLKAKTSSEEAKTRLTNMQTELTEAMREVLVGVLVGVNVGVEVLVGVLVGVNVGVS